MPRSEQRAAEDFIQFTEVMKTVHDNKGKGYDGERPYENHRRAGAFLGKPAWMYPVARINEKVHRVQRAIAGLDQETVSVEEELIDIANLAGIAWCLREEEKE